MLPRSYHDGSIHHPGTVTIHGVINQSDDTFVLVLEYLAPVQLSSDRHSMDTRADIWAVDILLFEMVIGSPSFRYSN
ncbi:hypothetical protein [Rubritalea sp.]|uniref:hypothetical protein n=1 Tax=Rubritalea sp. TaxID=2109375 RepID=UPI003EF57EA2